MDIRKTTGFYDLCVNVEGHEIENLHCVLSKLYQYGFRTVAINTNVDESVLVTDKKKKKRNDERESLQSGIPEVVDLEKTKKEFHGKLQIFNRITFFCSDPGRTHILNHSAMLKKYDLYAFVPKTQNALQYACTQLNADIITLKPIATNLKFNRKLYEQAIERGIHFEIQFVDLLNLQSRRNTISYALLLYTYGKSKNIILSSGANDIKPIRNPYDLLNVATVLGLNEIQAKASISHQCKRVLLRAESRRSGKAVFIIEKQTEESNIDEDDVKPTKRLKL